MRIAAMAFATAVTVTACSHVDTGAVDFRRAEPPPTKSETAGKLRQCRDDNSACKIEFSSQLIAQSMGPIHRIKKNDVYSISLESLTMGNRMLEGIFLGQELGKHAEFAVLVNAFEMNPDKANRFLNPWEYNNNEIDNGDNEFKLVFFGDDIQRGQVLNKVNLPVVPKSKYGGGSIGIQIVIVEVDGDNQKFTKLLDEVAKIGRDALTTDPGLLGTAIDLGKSLYEGGSGDDRLLDFRAVFEGAAAHDPWGAGALGPAFGQGRYVFVRAQDRQTEVDWSQLRYDYNTRVLRKDGKVYRENLNFSLAVRAFPADTPLENYSLEAWEDVDEQAKRLAGADLEILGVLADQMSDRVDRLVGDRAVEAVGERWISAVDALKIVASAAPSDLASATITQCADYADLRLRLSSAADDTALEARVELEAFIESYLRMTALESDTDATKKIVVSQDGKRALVAEIARQFTPWEMSDDWKAKLSSPETFLAMLQASDEKSAFVDEAVVRAEERRLEAKECAGLEMFR
ncbi:hypothetical protein [Sphingomicrobium marinum]|uniref:hypothetical protein n=1 Tax=Sphingomicrobium marinum TaxID=1227950 RepID=UPI002240AC40|nr:hypothetical protein [Sphingomicrobium marinum]